MVDHIGDLDANTTIIVPVKITLKTRTKRNFACGLFFLYHYFCGGARSNSVGIAISRGCRSNGVGGSDDGGDGGDGGGNDGGYRWSKNFIVI